MAEWKRRQKWMRKRSGERRDYGKEEETAVDGEKTDCRKSERENGSQKERKK